MSDNKKRRSGEAEKLKTCPACGKGGFVNLKSHRCSALAKTKRVDLELVPAPNETELREYAEHVRRVHGVIESKTRQFQQEVVYDLVELGLWFLKAKHSLGHGNYVDFLKSATVADLNISDRSANNYMNAARNAGLDHQSTATDIATLRDAQALHGRKPTDLYRLMDASIEAAQPEPETKFDLVRSMAFALRESCELVIHNRAHLSKKAFSTVCARLHRTLEELSGSAWDMVATRTGDPHFKEHGDIYEIGN